MKIKDEEESSNVHSSMRWSIHAAMYFDTLAENATACHCMRVQNLTISGAKTLMVYCNAQMPRWWDLIRVLRRTLSGSGRDYVSAFDTGVCDK